ncbi:hypothetical protein JKP88DRAFT_251354 [Tribonema minus]|uniref:Uncharacterized protein n=1 Tax=Tribonema minus TaxID=303371 RepID=A0A835ZDD1_9STRA|nr:hypothetical protein JKP88DRAFT_251354 [Tribonema minus]
MAGTWLLWQFAVVIALHTVFLQSAFIGTIPSVLPRLKQMFAFAMKPTDIPFYDGGAPFNVNYGKAPVARFAHVLVALPWSFLAAIQLNAGFRKRFPRTHRRMGYVFVMLDVVMMVGAFDFMAKKAGFVHVERHQLAVYSRLAFVALAFLASGAAAVAFARRRDFSAHKRAALHHVAIGHAVSTQRLLLQLRGMVLGARSAARSVLCTGAVLTEGLGAGALQGVLGGFCGATGEGVLPQEQRQLLFGTLVFAGMFINCALVELYYAVSPSTSPRSKSGSVLSSSLASDCKSIAAGNAATAVTTPSLSPTMSPNRAEPPTST